MYKSKLQELCHRRSWHLPAYRTVRDGPDHKPNFASTVTVNGVPFESPQNQCRSSKEAENLAAQLAFDHLNAANAVNLEQNRNNLSNSVAASLPSPHPSGYSSLSTQGNIELAGQGILHSKQEDNAQASGVNELLFGSKDDKRPKDIVHMYKNRLQNYAQKHNLTLPAYSCEFEGPPHARLFRSKVIINDKTYETSEFFRTLKEAENAAAKLAFQSLSHGDIQEDRGLYKTLLQELAQKEGLLFPTYSTIKFGPPHMPTFTSTVEIGGDVFKGREAKTKKQAEMAAAKVAYNALAERRMAQNPPDNQTRASDASFQLQSILNNGSPQDIANDYPVNVEQAADKEFILKEVSVISSSSIGSAVPADLQQNTQPIAKRSASENLNEEDQDAKRQRSYSSTTS